MKHQIRKTAAVLCAGLLLLTCGCGKKVSASELGSLTGGSGGAPDYQQADAGELFSGRDYEVGYDESSAVSVTLTGDSAISSGSGVEITGSTVTITREGSYLLSGTLSDGMIIVDADKNEKVQLVLNGVSISSLSSAAIYVRQADKVFITTAADSENMLTNGGSFKAVDENNIDAVIFSKEDLTLNGQGSLSLLSPAGHGIVSKDDLRITSGTYLIDASSHALSGKDSVRIAAGAFEITAGKHGIHADNDEDESLGSVYILGGTYSLTANEDGINASGSVQISGGTLEISVKDDGIHADGTLAVTDGKITVNECYEGLEGYDVAVSGGDIYINASDDGINAAGGSDGSGNWGGKGKLDWDGSMNGVPENGMEGDWNGGPENGMEGDWNGVPENGMEGDWNGGPENGMGGGLNGRDMQRGGRDMPQDGADVPQDGFAQDVADDMRGGQFAGQFGGGGAAGGFGTSSGSIVISGGTIVIRASGDAIDSNGSLSVTGGTIVTSGPDSGDTSILDYDSSGTISGGSFLGTGASSMAQNFDSSSAQGVIMVMTGRQAAGAAVTLTDSDGKVLMSHEADQAFSCVVFSCEAITAGKSYTVSAGSYTQTITMESTVYTPSGTGGMPGRGGMTGSDRGNMQKPGGMR